MVSFVPLTLATAGFVALAVAAVGRARALGHRPSRHLAAVFTALAAAGTVTLLSDVLPLPHVAERVLLLGGFAGLVAYPYLLLRFVDDLETVPPRVRIAVGTFAGVLALFMGWALVAELPDAFRVSIRVLLVVYVAVWTLAHVVAARSLWRAGRRLGSSLARRRAAAMTAGTAGLGAVFLGAVLASTDVAVAIGLGSAALLWLGFAPPTAVRVVWSLPDTAALTEAEDELLRSGDTDVVTRDLLPAVARLLDGEAAWITDGEALVAVSGARPSEVDDVRAVLGRGTAGRPVEIVRGADGYWLVAAPTGTGWMVVRTTDEPVLFGAGDSSALRVVATRTNLLLRRAEIELREREAARHLREAQHLEEVTRLKDDVLSTLSHELRTPLVTIRGASEMLVQRWDVLPEEQRHAFVTRIDANARDLHRLVTDTLHLATLRAGEQAVAPEDVAIGAVVARALDDITPEGRERVRVDVADVRLHTDEDHLGGVLRQLIGNAIKFSDGPVDVRARHQGDRTIVVVSDNGAGMTADELERVTQPMFRGGDVLHRTTRGLGIGLTLACAITESLGGSLELRSAPGVGTVATVNVPTRPRVSPRRDREPAPRVLVVAGNR